MPELVPLFHKVKRWAKAHDLHGSDRGHLSSYAFAQMCVFFLQVTGWLPSLQRVPERGLRELEWHCEKVPEQPDKWYSVGFAKPEDAETRDAMEWTRRATSSTDVFEPNDFWDFYASEFEWGTHVVSVRQ